jgi:S1-C subfamily serine protease
MNGATANQRRRVSAKRVLAGATIGAMTLLGVGVSSASAAAPVAPATLTPPQIAQRVEPAIELIETDTTGSIRYYDVTLQNAALIQWARQDPSVNGAGNMPDAVRAVISAIRQYPGNFLAKGDGTTVSPELVSLGSGFNVTPDGYIVTNAHVATISKSDAEQGFLNGTLQPAVAAIVHSFEQQLATMNYNGAPLQVPADQQPVVQGIIENFILNTAEVGDITTTVYAGGGPNISEDLVHKGQVARVVTAGVPFPGKDVAILKIEATDLPTVPLGDDTQLQTGDPVYATGYPGDATFDPSVVSPDVTAQPTLSVGTVSNRLQSSAANYQYIENTATINHGNSGGALVNAAGQVVGITTASDSSTEAADGNNGGKFFYAVPTSVVRAFLTDNQITPTASPDQALFDTAVDLMTGQHYKAAVADLQKVSADGFSTPYVQQNLQRANAAVAAGKDLPLSSKKASVLPLAGAAAAVLLLLLGLVIVSMRRRRRVPTSPAPVAIPAAFVAATAPFAPPPSPVPAPPVPAPPVPVQPVPVAEAAPVPASASVSAPAWGNSSGSFI